MPKVVITHSVVDVDAWLKQQAAVTSAIAAPPA